MTGSQAVASIRGGTLYPDIVGKAVFTETDGGTVVDVIVYNLPQFERGSAAIGPHGFHIHTGDSCEAGTDDNPFPQSGMHYNPYNQPHGNHAGDFPVLFSNGGRASMRFFTDRFLPAQVVGKALIIHESPDDYRTEPSGNSGRKIACGIIK